MYVTDKHRQSGRESAIQAMAYKALKTLNKSQTMKINNTSEEEWIENYRKLWYRESSEVAEKELFNGGTSIILVVMFLTSTTFIQKQ